MAKNDTKSKAEVYREERKERIAKANKKNAKKINAGKAVSGVVKKVVAVVLVAAIVFGACYYLARTTGIVNKLATAEKVGSTKVSAAEYNYYYNNMYQQMLYYAQMYSQYGMDMGYDTNLAPDKQTTKDDEGNEVTWAEYFRKSAADRAQFVEAYYNEAVKAGFELDEDAKKEIDETFENYKSNASENNFSMNAYLKATFGPGFSEKMFKEQLLKEETASHYREKIEADTKAAIAKETIEKEYADNQKDYDYVDVCYYIFTGTALTAKDGETDEELAKRQEEANKKLFADVKEVYKDAKDADTLEAAVKAYKEADKKDDTKAADETAAEATAAEETTEAAAAEDAKAEETKTDDTKAEDAKAEDAEAEDAKAEDAEAAENTAEAEEETKYCTTSKHATYSSLSSAMNDKVADWAYAKDTKDGDVKYFENGNDAYIVVLQKKAYTSHSVDVRQCLVKYDAADENNVTDEEKAAAKKKAEDLLKEWKDGEATEESFSKMATDNTGDTASAESGGLYAGVRVTDNYVEPFLDWCFDPARKEGEAGIIETEYGYHIMYFVKSNDSDVDWEASIREKLGSDEFTKKDEALLAEDGDYKVETSDFWTKLVMKQFCKKINKNLAYSASK